MTLHRMQTLVFVSFLAAGVATASTEMPVLSNMIHSADQIYHIMILERTGPIVDRVGFGEWNYRCKVMRSHRGSLKPGDALYFHFTTRDSKEFQEHPKGEVEKQYIVFLRPASESPFSVGVSVDKDGRATKTSPSYLLLDQWLGILPWDNNLDKDIQRLLSKADETHNKPSDATSQ